MIFANVQRRFSCSNVKHLSLMCLLFLTMIIQSGCHKNLGFQGQNDKAKLTIKTNDQGVFNEVTTLTIGERCYQDLCSANDHSMDFKYILNFARQGNAESHQVYERDIQDELQKLLKINLELQSLQQSSINEITTQITKMKYNQLQLNYFAFVEYYVHQGSELGKNDQNNQRVQFFKNLISKLDLSKNMTTNDNHPEKFYLELHKKESLNEALNQEIKFITELNKKTKNDFKDILFESTDIFKELLSQQEKNISLLKKAMRKSITLHLFNDFVYSDLLQKNHFQYTDLNLAINERLNKLKTSKFDNQKSMNQKLNQCRAIWNANFNLHPTDQQILKLKTKTQEVVQGMKSFLIVQYPELNDALANINFQYPENKDKTKLRWIHTIQNRIKQYELYKQQYGLLNLENKFLFILSNLKTLLNFDCEVLFDIDPMDQFNTREKKVILSWVPAMYPQFATSLISHEIAHYIFDYVDSFHDEKMCLAGKQNSEKYLEEDFSDAIASSYLSSIKNNKEDEFYACALASLDEKQSLKNDDFFDNHSTNLYRALQHHIQLGQTVPESCRELINEEQIGHFDKKCTTQLIQ